MIFNLFNVYSSMANIYNQLNEITNIAYEYPCENDELILKGLKEGELFISYNPNYIQNSNGVLVGIDSRFTKFYILNSKKEVIDTLELTWRNDCEEIIVNEQVDIKHDYNLLILIITIITIMIIKILRRKK